MFSNLATKLISTKKLKKNNQKNYLFQFFSSKFFPTFDVPDSRTSKLRNQIQHSWQRRVWKEMTGGHVLHRGKIPHFEVGSAQILHLRKLKIATHHWAVPSAPRRNRQLFNRPSTYNPYTPLDIYVYVYLKIIHTLKILFPNPFKLKTPKFKKKWRGLDSNTP